MGGNALKNTPTRRYERTEYFNLCTEVRDRLRQFGHFWSYDVVEAYASKDSFGDMDVLYCTFDNKPLNVENVKEMFDFKEAVRNTDVISFDHKEFQIDLIHAEMEYFDYAKNYFAFNDLGNLIGRITKQFGLKHGHNGLQFPVRDGDTVYKELLVTNDHAETLMFIGLDPGVYAKGFDTLEDIFKFVISSPFFNPAFYKLENLNHVARIRDRKRATYNKFLEYIEGMEGDFWVPNKKAEAYLPHVFEYFPDLEKDYLEVTNEIASNRYVRSKFNGNIVMEMTGLTDAKLGMFMKHLKTRFWFQPHMLVLQTPEAIQERVMVEFVEGEWT